MELPQHEDQGGVARDGDLFLVGGGPSLVGFDFSRLRRRRVLAVCRAYEVVPWAEVLWWTDRRFWDWRRDHILRAFQGRLCTSDVRKDNHPRLEHWRLTGSSGLDTIPGQIRHGNSSGYAAINLAFHLGAGRAILLGYDMRHAGGRTHWHDGYPIATRESAIDKMLPYFKTLVDPLRAAGMDVVNATPGSAITCFQTVTYDEVLP